MHEFIAQIFRLIGWVTLAGIVYVLLFGNMLFASPSSGYKNERIFTGDGRSTVQNTDGGSFVLTDAKRGMTSNDIVSKPALAVLCDSMEHAISSHYYEYCFIPTYYSTLSYDMGITDYGDIIDVDLFYNTSMMDDTLSVRHDLQLSAFSRVFSNPLEGHLTTTSWSEGSKNVFYNYRN